jgi:MFS family permease
MSETRNGTIVDPAKYRGRVLTASILAYTFDSMDIMVFALALPLLFREWGTFTYVQAGLIGTCMLLGMGLGGYVFGALGDKYGRKRVLVWCVAFFGLTTGLAGFSQNYLQLAALRFVAGLALGAEWALGGTLVQEFYPPGKRGSVSSYMMQGWPLGFAIAVLVQYLFVPSFGWRALYFSGTVAVFVAIWIYLFVPESPIWLKHQEDKKKGAAQTAANGAKTTDLFRAGNLYALIFVSLLFISLMICYWAVNTWLPTILAKERGMNLKSMTSFLFGLQISCAIGFFVSGFVSRVISKRATMALFSFLAAVTLYIWLGLEWSDTVFMIIGLVHWGLASAIWGVASGFTVEQFPTNIRALGAASTYGTGRLVSTLVPITMGAAAAQIGLVTVMAAVSFFYIVTLFAVLMLRDSTAHI